METTARPWPLATLSDKAMHRPLHEGRSDDTADDMRGGSAPEWSLPVVCEPLEQWRSKVLRKEVYRLKLPVVRSGPHTNDCKAGYIALLRGHRERASTAEAVVAMARPWRHESEPPQGESTEIQWEPRTQGPPPPWFPVSTQVPSYEASGSPPRELTAPALDPTGEGTDVLHALHPQGTETIDAREGYASDTRCSYGTDDENELGDESLATLTAPTSAQCIGNDGAMLQDQEHVSGAEDRRKNTLDGFAEDVPKRMSDDELDATIKRTHYWESRLTKSKRTIRELHGELETTDDGEEIQLLQEELAYYTRERKRAVRSLLMDSSDFLLGVTTEVNHNNN